MRSRRIIKRDVTVRWVFGSLFSVVPFSEMKNQS
jgi:hypothetical protein